MRWNFWRALTDNDLGWKVDQKLGDWQKAAEQVKVENIAIQKDGLGKIWVSVTALIPQRQARIQIKHTFAKDGIIHMGCRFLPEGKKAKATSDLPRLGIQFAMPEEFAQVTWYGRGPHENYWDRKTSAPIGRYQSTVNDWITPYVRPQENANRCDIRWFTLTNEAGIGLRFDASPKTPLSVSAWPYSMDDLTKASHDFKLPRRDFITVNLDHLQMGVGGDNSWGLPVNDPYIIKSDKTYAWSFTISPVRK